MWHLRRVHMESIGHPDARFDPLTTDFIDTAGTPTSSVLWLENMGGKTSWLSLVFSTLCPALRDFLGKPEKQLGDYILGSDTAHVILEFSQVIGVRSLIGGDTRLLLGQVLQWRDHRQDRARESTALQRRLWGVVTPPGRSPTFEDALHLIRVDGTRRRPLPEYIDGLTSALQGCDAFRPSTHQGEWADWLRGHGLDTEVFSDQLKMSADEGSISERFHFENGDELVQWALPYIIPPEIPNQISDIVEQVRDTLSKRPRLLHQQNFCADVQAKLSDAATQQTELCAQRDEATEAWNSSLSLVDQLRAAKSAAESRSAHHQQEARRLKSDADQALTLRNKLQAQRREAELVQARLKHAEAVTKHTEALRKREQAQQHVDSWELTAEIKRLSEIDLRLEQIQVVLDDADDAAAPLRDAVSAAQQQLAAKLTHLRKADEASLDQIKSQIVLERQAIKEADGRSQTAAAERLHAEREATGALKDLEHLAAEMAEAVRDGLLDQDQPVDDAILSKNADVQRLAAEIERQTGLADKAKHDRIAADKAAEGASQALVTLQAQLTRARERSDEITSAAAQLLYIPEIAAAFETPHPDLWHDGPSAAARLAQQAETTSAQRIAVELRSVADRRAVNELDRSGWLPPSSDVEDVLAALDEAGIRNAFSGWQVLREQFPEDRHLDIISQHPEIVNGVILADTDELEAAVQATDGLSLSAPTALVAGTGRLFEEELATVIVAGPAALHHRVAASREGSRRNEQLEASERASQEAAVRGEALQSARAQLVSFIESNPAETVAALRTEALDLPSQISKAELALTAAAKSSDAAETRIQDAADRLRAAQDEHGHAQRAEANLKRLKDRQIRRASHQRALDDAEARIRDIGSRTAAAAEARREASERLAEAQRAATEIRFRIDNVGSRFIRHGLTTTEHPPSEDPLDNLESALETAQQELHAAAPPDLVTRERNTLAKEKAERSELLRNNTEATVALARRLLASPAGATTHTRHAAISDAKSHLLQSHTEEALASQALRQAEAEMRRREEAAQHSRAPLDKHPKSPEQAQKLIEHLTTESTAANTRHETASRQQTHHTQMMESIDRDADAFRRECDTLTATLRRHASAMNRPSEALDECRDSTPWPGDPGNAEQECRRHETMLDETAVYMRLATEERDRSLDKVRQLASEHRDLLAEDMPTLLPRLTEGPSDQRGTYAGELADQLHTYALTITKDLDDLEHHRRVVIDHLAGNVTQTIKLLSRLQRRTSLPEGLDDWSKRTFLSLTHPKLPTTPGELAGRVATVVDQICSDSTEVRTSGMDLLYAAVSASVGGPFSATILKPHKRLTNQRVDISEMASFSGGQKLTAALVIFAALTRMRTEAHSSSRYASAALPLLLDNPIGKANQATLMEVQQRVGEAFGLQLIYTTGLDDMGALASFNNIIRLDGRQNPRSGDVHVVVDGDQANSTFLDSIRLQQHGPIVG